MTCILLISVQNELTSRANSLSGTWVKYFYVCALAQSSWPTAQWTKSLSDANNPPTLSSAASLERCQVCWVYALWGDPSSVWLACRLGTQTGLFEVHCRQWQCCWLRVQWLTVEQQADTRDPTRTVSPYHLWLFHWKSDSLKLATDVARFCKLQTAIVLFFLPYISLCFCKYEWIRLSCQSNCKCVMFLRCLCQDFQDFTWRAAPVRRLSRATSAVSSYLLSFFLCLFFFAPLFYLSTSLLPLTCHSVLIV